MSVAKMTGIKYECALCGRRLESQLTMGISTENFRHINLEHPELAIAVKHIREENESLLNALSDLIYKPKGSKL